MTNDKNKNPTWGIPSDLRFHTTEYVVDATHEESHQLWYKYCMLWGSKWDQDSLGYYEQIGTVDGRPICVTVVWFIIEGLFRVAFVEGTSQLVDYKMISDWENAVFRCMRDEYGRHSNAGNFGHILGDISRRLGRDIFKNNWKDVENSYLRGVR